MEGLNTRKDYTAIATEFQGHAGNGPAQHMINWSIIRLIGEFSDTFSCICGLILSLTLVKVINKCLETCTYANHSNIPLYARSYSLMEISSILVSNTAFSTYSIMVGAIPVYLYGSFIDIFEMFPEVVIENYMFLLCLLIGEEFKAIKHEMRKEAHGSVRPLVLPQVESYKTEASQGLSSRMKRLRQHHLDVLDLVELINKRFEAYIFICLFGCFVNPIMMLYRVLLELGTLTSFSSLRALLRISNYLMVGMVHIFSTWILCKGPQTIKDQLKDLDLELHKIQISGSLPRSQTLEVFYMRKQCQMDCSDIRIFGMFSLNTSFFFSMVVGIISYITVLKQFNVDGRSFTNPEEFLQIHRFYFQKNQTHEEH